MIALSEPAACPSDDAVAAWLEHRVDRRREAELEAHFEACPRCRTLIATLAHASAEDVAPDDDEHFGRYRLRGRLGRGGMGVVERAWDPELGREVALKRLPVPRADRRDRERLLREARALARLAHPSIVAVYDVGVVGDEVFFAMELVHGQTLAARLAGGALPWRDALALLVPAAEGLAAAHAVGLVHRDFKPTNVMIADGPPPHARVLDFGLARATDVASDPAERTPGARTSAERTGSSTHDGAVVGTPMYMAPEQHLGLPAGAPADQFSFCVVLFEAIWGRRPYAGRSAVELAARVLDGELDPGPPPRGVPRWLEHSIRRGLRTDPAQRHSSMHALVERLRRGAARRPRLWPAIVGVGAVAVAWANVDRGGPPSCEALARAMDETRRDATGSGAVVAAIDDYVARWQVLHAEVCRVGHDPRVACLARSRLAVEALVTALDDDGASRFAIDAADRLPPLEQCAEQRSAPPEPPDDQAAAVEIVRGLHAQAMVHSELGDHDAAQTLAADALARAHALGFAPLVAEELLLTALVAAEAGVPLEAERFAAEASEVAEAADHVQTQIDAALLSARLALDRNDPATADRWAGHARARLERSGADPVTEVDLRALDGAIAATAADPAPALAILTVVGEDYEHLLGPVHTKVLTTGVAIARLQRRSGDTAGALASYARLAATTEARFGAHHPMLATILNNTGTVLADARRLDEAADCFERAAQIREEVLGPTHLQLANTLLNLANIRHERGDDDQAVLLYRRAIDIWTARLGPDHAVVAEGWRNLAVALEHLGRLDEALRAREHALDVARPLWPDDDIRVASHVCGRAEVLARLGRDRDARAAFVRCLPTLARELGPDDRDLANARRLAAALGVEG